MFSFPTLRDRLANYRALRTKLLEGRALEGWRPEHDREILGEMADVYEELSEIERELVESEGLPT